MNITVWVLVFSFFVGGPSRTAIVIDNIASREECLRVAAELRMTWKKDESGALEARCVAVRKVYP